MKKHIALYGYIFIITIIFLYSLFPGKAVTSYINYKLADSSPELYLTIDRIKPSFPPGLSFKASSLFRGDKELFEITRMNIRPELTTLFSSTKSFILTGSSYGGGINGKLDLTANKSLLNVDLHINHIELDNIPGIKAAMPHKISGIINGNVNFNNSPPFGSGKADLSITGCQIDFKPALFGMDQLKLDTVDASAELKGQQVKIDKFNINGRQVSGNVSGALFLRNPLITSSVNLSGQVKPTTDLMKNLAKVFPIAAMTGKNAAGKSIPFRMSGTIDDPNFSLK